MHLKFQIVIVVFISCCLASTTSTFLGLNSQNLWTWKQQSILAGRPGGHQLFSFRPAFTLFTNLTRPLNTTTTRPVGGVTSGTTGATTRPTTAITTRPTTTPTTPRPFVIIGAPQIYGIPGHPFMGNYPMGYSELMYLPMAALLPPTNLVGQGVSASVIAGQVGGAGQAVLPVGQLVGGGQFPQIGHNFPVYLPSPLRPQSLLSLLRRPGILGK